MVGSEGSGGVAGGDSREVALARERSVASCVAGDVAENAERQREPDVEKNGMEEPLEEAAANARRIYR